METMTKRIVAKYSNRAWTKPHFFQLCPTKLSTNARFFFATISSSSQYSIQKTLLDFNPYAQAVGTIFGTMTVLFGALAFVVNEIAKAKKDIEIVEVNRKRDSEISKKNDEILDFKARTAIAEYKAMIANQFLVYGYAEEYTRLQKMMGVYKGDELSTEIDKMGLKKKAGVYVDGKSSKPID